MFGNIFKICQNYFIKITFKITAILILKVIINNEINKISYKNKITFNKIKIGTIFQSFLLQKL